MGGLNFSGNRFRLVRSISGRKTTHGQLVALCPQHGEQFILPQTTSLMQDKAGGLIAGIKALPGLPLATQPVHLINFKTASAVNTNVYSCSRLYRQRQANNHLLYLKAGTAADEKSSYSQIMPGK